MNIPVRLRVPVNEADHRQGPIDAPVTLVEYGDYECPHCGRAYPIVKRIQAEMGDDLRFVFRNFPLREAHPFAWNAARAAEAAGLQDRFWDMHDRLFENQDALDDESLVAYAKILRLDPALFMRDRRSRRVEAKVAADFEGGLRSGVNGTPTFYVNGYRYDGDWSLEPFLEALSSSAFRG